MKIKLSIGLRLRISEFLADEESDEGTMRLVREARKELGLSEAEYLAVGYSRTILPDGRAMAKWDESKDPNKEIDFGQVVSNTIKRKLYRMDHEAKLKEVHLDLYDIFVEPKK